MPTTTPLAKLLTHFTSHEPAQSSHYFTDGKKILAFGIITLAEWVRWPIEHESATDAVLIRSSGYPNASIRQFCVRIRAYCLLRNIPIILSSKLKKESPDLSYSKEMNLYKPRISRLNLSPTPRLLPRKRESK